VTYRFFLYFIHPEAYSDLARREGFCVPEGGGGRRRLARKRLHWPGGGTVAKPWPAAGRRRAAKWGLGWWGGVGGGGVEGRRERRGVGETPVGSAIPVDGYSVVNPLELINIKKITVATIRIQIYSGLETNLLMIWTSRDSELIH
jgi:hypothetical protein